MSWRTDTDSWSRVVLGAICPRCGAVIPEALLATHGTVCGCVDCPDDGGGGPTPVPPIDPPVIPPSSENVVGEFRRAFPGAGPIMQAQGCGATALSFADRRKATIYQVTNLNNDGPGSFRQALTDANLGDQDALKIITFTVGGTIDLKSGISLPDREGPSEFKQFRNVYIAGQTAPGGGITIKQQNGGRRIELHYDVQDWVWRGVRFRWGYNEVANSGDINLLMRQWDRLMIADCTFSWAPGRNIQVTVQRLTRSAKGLHGTIQNCMFYESFAPHRTAMSGFGGDNEDHENGGDSTGVTSNNSFYRNYMASAQRRAPNLGTYCENINNVSFNITEDAGWGGPMSFQDHIGNVAILGPNLKPDYYIPLNILTRQLFDEHQMYEKMGGPSFYLKSNIWLGRPGTDDPDRLTDVDADNWSNDAVMSLRGPHSSDRGWIGAQYGQWEELEAEIANGTHGFTGLDEFRRDKRLWEIGPGDREWEVSKHEGAPVFPVHIMNPYHIIDPMKKHVGPAWRVNEAGEWVHDRRDEADARIIEEWDTGNPSVTHLGQLEGTREYMDARYPYPALAKGTPPTDSNGDGIPDAYYEAMGYDPAGPSRAGNIGHDGYSFAENWINGRDHHTGDMRFAA